MATINGLIGFHPHMSSLSSLQHKSHVLHIALQYCVHLTPRQRSSFNKIPRKFTLITKRATSHASDSSQPESEPHQVPPAKSPSSTWLVNMNGIGGLGKLDTAIETVESVAEVVEELAEEVDKVSEQIEDKLPEDAKLKTAVESIEHLAEEAVQKAKQAEDIIHKVKEVEKQVEEALITGSNDKQ